MYCQGSLQFHHSLPYILPSTLFLITQRYAVYETVDIMSQIQKTEKGTYEDTNKKLCLNLSYVSKQYTSLLLSIITINLIVLPLDLFHV